MKLKIWQRYKFYLFIVAASLFVGITIGQLSNLNYQKNVIQHGDFDYLLKQNTKVKVYGTSWCKYCNKLENYLKNNRIEYAFVDVEKSKNGMEEFKRVKGKSYPLIVTPQAIIKGFDEEIIRKELKRQELM